MTCCAMTWVGPDRAHCYRRTRGCGHVFDDAALYDAHRHNGSCLDPRTLGLVPTRNGIWLRALDHPGTSLSTAAKA
jgi:hypothetical protein